MKLIFNDYEIVMSTSNSFVEGETIDILVFEGIKPKEKGRHIKRKVNFDKEAGDLYITYKHKRYFYSEFE